MRNDSIETLLGRHYGSAAPTPIGLEQRLHQAARQQIVEQQQEQRAAAYLRTHHVSRRRAVRLVAVSSAGLGALSLGLEGLHILGAAIVGNDATQPA